MCWCWAALCFKRPCSICKTVTSRILGHGAADNAPYVQSLTVNGQTWNKPWIRFPDIARGSKFIFTLGAAPDTNWGSSPLDAPPSFTAESDSHR